MTREDSEPLLLILTGLACGWWTIQASWPAERFTGHPAISAARVQALHKPHQGSICSFA